MLSLEPSPAALLAASQTIYALLHSGERRTIYVGLFDLLPSRFKREGREATYPFYQRAPLYVPEGVAFCPQSGGVTTVQVIRFVPIPCNRVRYVAGVGLWLTSYDARPVLWAPWARPLRIDWGPGYYHLILPAGALALA